MKIQLNNDLLKHTKDDIITLVTRNGIPVDPYWRRRIKDSAIDGCITILEQNKKEVEIKENEAKEETNIEEHELKPKKQKK